MAISRLNHAVLYVRDAVATAAFYTEHLGFVVAHEFPGAAFLCTNAETPNDHDLGLFTIGGAAAPSSAGQSSVGLYHLAWEVPTLGEMLELGVRIEDGDEALDDHVEDFLLGVAEFRGFAGGDDGKVVGDFLVVENSAEVCEAGAAVGVSFEHCGRVFGDG